jgi:hypothetical protein
MFWQTITLLILCLVLLATARYLKWKQESEQKKLSVINKPSQNPRRIIHIPKDTAARFDLSREYGDSLATARSRG